MSNETIPPSQLGYYNCPTSSCNYRTVAATPTICPECVENRDKQIKLKQTTPYNHCLNRTDVEELREELHSARVAHDPTIARSLYSKVKYIETQFDRLLDGKDLTYHEVEY